MTLDPKVEAACKAYVDTYHEIFGDVERWEDYNPQQAEVMRKCIRAALSTAPSGQAPLEGVKALEWDGSEASSPVGGYRVQRLDDKWEPLHRGNYMLPRRHGVVAAFNTQDEAKDFCQAHFNAAIRSALVPASAEPVAHPLAAFPDGIVPGLYIVHWKSGGTSKAAIGMLPSGNRWIAPTNWVRPGTWPAADEWHDIDHVEPVLADDPPARGAVEAGWQLVPKEPTEAMLDAYWNQCGESKEMRSRTHAYGKRYYAAMLAAAPTEGR